jgi:hypothetical protein
MDPDTRWKNESLAVRKRARQVFLRGGRYRYSASNLRGYAGHSVPAGKQGPIGGVIRGP